MRRIWILLIMIAATGQAFAQNRLYGPLQPWFDQTWRPGEFELVK